VLFTHGLEPAMVRAETVNFFTVKLILLVESVLTVCLYPIRSSLKAVSLSCHYQNSENESESSLATRELSPFHFPSRQSRDRSARVTSVHPHAPTQHSLRRRREGRSTNEN
jgi:hypothetical protein